MLQIEDGRKIKKLEEQIEDERARLSTDRMDISFGELINMYKAGELIIRPEYQRLFRWTGSQKAMLIESILLGIPVPPIFVAEDKEGIWELVDGLQRVSTIISFFGDLDGKLLTTDFQEEYEEYEEENNFNTESNVGFSVLNKLLLQFSLQPFPEHWERYTYPDSNLKDTLNTFLRYRNGVAHGGDISSEEKITQDVYAKYRMLVDDLMYSMHDKFMEGIQNRTYQKVQEG